MKNRLRMMFARAASPFTSRGRLETELDAEMRAHLDLLADEHRQRGLSPEEAQAAALRDFGGVAHIKDVYRDQRGIPFLDTLGQDIRYALRAWRREPGFTLVVIAVLALGIGVNSAIFTIVDAVLLRPLSGRAGELVGVYSHDRTQPSSYRSFSYPEFLDVRDRGDVFESLIAHTFAHVGVPAGDVSRSASVEIVSADYFSTVGVQLAAGRVFSAEEARPGADQAVVVIGFNRWKQEGFDPALLGRTIRINTRDFVIVGVTPEGFTGTTLLTPQLWVPLGMFDTVVNDGFKNDGGVGSRTRRGLLLAGRIRPGLSLNAANARLEAVSSELEQAYPAENKNEVLSVHPLSRTSITGGPSSDAGPMVVSGAVMPLSGAVLLIACLNLANMFLARGTSRRKEIAIRLALGGGRRRIIRQLITESLLLALAGGSVGLLLGSWTIRAVVSSLSGVLPLHLPLDSRPDLNVTLATTVIAVLSTLVFGLAPALKISRPDVVADLKELGAGQSALGARSGTRGWLVAGQMAMSLMLITTGALFARTAVKATSTDPGYRYDGLLLASVDPGLAGYDELRGRAALVSALDRVRGLTGVQAAAMTSQVPFGDFQEGLSVERPGVSSDARFVRYTSVSAGYFATLGLPLLRGRDFDRNEERAPGAGQVAIIDEPLARMLFPGEDPLGQLIHPVVPRQGRRAREQTQPLEIVGVVPGVRDDLFEPSANGHLYVPFASSYHANMHIHARLPRERASAAAETLKAIRRELSAVDAHLPIVDLITMQGFHDRGLLLWVIHAASRMFTTFGALALLLAAVGVYGVKSYVVSQRTREIGIRMALGARPLDIFWLMLRDGARTTAMGLAIGFPLAVGLGILLSTEIYDMNPFDPLVLTLAPTVLVAAAALATYVPARRATRVAPLDALRTE